MHHVGPCITLGVTLIRGEANQVGKRATETQLFYLSALLPPTMGTSIPDKLVYTEADIQSAICAPERKECTSIRHAAGAYDIPYPTLRGRVAGRTSRATAHEPSQILSNTEERTLVRWITCLTRTAFSASPALVVQMAEEIRRGREQLSKKPPPSPRPIGEE